MNYTRYKFFYFGFYFIILKKTKLAMLVLATFLEDKCTYEMSEWLDK